MIHGERFKQRVHPTTPAVPGHRKDGRFDEHNQEGKKRKRVGSTSSLEKFDEQTWKRMRLDQQ